MTEQTPTPGPDEIGSDEVGEDPPMRTGVPTVDGVLSEIDELDELPLDQHLATYERAHDALRTALDAPTGPAADEPA
jgi:hypothetical protein